LRIVALLLIAWEPLRFANEALTVLPTITARGGLAAIELLVHGAVAAICAGAGLALWNSSPDGRKLGAIAVGAAASRAVQSLYWSALPNNTVPGDEPLIAGLTAIVAVGAIVALRRVSA